MLLVAYANGYFPMALDKDDPELYWFAPEERGVLPIEGFNVPRGLARAMKKYDYTVTVNRDFDAVIRACGTLTRHRQDTWINDEIIRLYTALHRMGHAHSVEVWLPDHGDEALRSAAAARAVVTAGLSPQGEGEESPPSEHMLLVGGLYGVSLGGVFFGESMFSRASESSKIALVTLVEILREAGYAMLDTQYVNDHLKQFGVEAVPKRRYMTKLEKALKASPNPSTLFSTVSVRRGLASASSAS
ncbi:MAG: leucyl/phenylalanyl-tRNA--protein transferase [Azospirillum brasilense]|nr:MAG: leucyl/phenylalanyl-tRNA--protein transferase [Azospirillum brasilense]